MFFIETQVSDTGHLGLLFFYKSLAGVDIMHDLVEIGHKYTRSYVRFAVQYLKH